MARRRDTRSKIQKVSTRNTIAERFIRGESAIAIASYLEMDLDFIEAEIEALRKLWRETAPAPLNEWYNRESFYLDLLAREAWAAWEASKQPEERTLSEQLRSAVSDTEQMAMFDGINARVRVQKQTRTRTGDLRCLKALLEIQQQRTAIQEQYHRMTGDNGLGTMQNLHLNDAQVETIMGLLEGG